MLEGQFTKATLYNPSSRIDTTYFFPAGTGAYSHYDSREWEEVKPEWKDVSAQVEEFTGWWDGMRKVCDMQDGYRLRKISYEDGVHRGTSLQYRHAFIIEQRQA